LWKSTTRRGAEDSTAISDIGFPNAAAVPGLEVI
jgi:hypothetical protein